MRNLLPDLGKELHRWSGQILDTIDYAAFIGLNPGSKRTYVSTGDSGQGITHGAVAGMLISDLILKGEKPVDRSLRAEPQAAKGAPAHSSARTSPFRRISPSTSRRAKEDSWDELKPGEGAIVRKGLTKVAAYRDEKGQAFSALGRVPAPRLPRPLEQLRERAGIAPAMAPSSRRTARRSTAPPFPA